MLKLKVGMEVRVKSKQALQAFQEEYHYVDRYGDSIVVGMENLGGHIYVVDKVFNSGTMCRFKGYNWNIAWLEIPFTKLGNIIKDGL